MKSKQSKAKTDAKSAAKSDAKSVLQSPEFRKKLSQRPDLEGFGQPTRDQAIESAIQSVADEVESGDCPILKSRAPSKTKLLEYAAKRAEEFCLLLMLTYETLTSPEFAAKVCRRRSLRNYDKRLRKDAVELSIAKTIERMISGRFFPDPGKDLAAYIARKADWIAKDWLRKPLPVQTDFGFLAGRNSSDDASDEEMAALFAAAMELRPRLRAAFWSDPDCPWLHSVAQFVAERPTARQPDVAVYAGFPPNQSFAQAKHRAHDQLGERAGELIKDSAALDKALADALASADATLVGDPRRLVESSLSVIGAKFAAGALREARRRRLPIPLVFATEVALRLDVGNDSDEARGLLALVLSRPSDPTLRAQVSVALGVVLDHQASHAEDERDFDKAFELLVFADKVMRRAAADATLHDDAWWWLEYQLELNRRRRVEVRRATEVEGRSPSEAQAARIELKAQLFGVKEKFQTLRAGASDVAQRLAVNHQIVVVETLLAELLRDAGDLDAAKKAFTAAEDALLETRWTAVAHGKNSGRRYAYSYRRLGLVYAELAELAAKPKEWENYRKLSYSELQHAQTLAKKHQYVRLQREIEKHLATLFPNGPPRDATATKDDRP